MTTLNLYSAPLIDTRMILTSANVLGIAMNASNNALAAMFVAENVALHGPIIGLLYSCTAVTSPPSYRFSLQGISSRGTPDGTVKGGASPASVALTPSVGFGLATFVNSYSPTTGDLLAAVCEYSSGTIGASNRMTLTARAAQIGSSYSPYYSVQTAGTWAVGSGGSPSIAPVYSDGYVGRDFFAPASISNNVTASTSYGSVWTPAMACGFTGAIVGIQPAAGSNLQVTLYEGSSTTIASTTIVSQSPNLSCDLFCPSTAAINGLFVAMPSYQLKANTTYRLVVTNSGTAYTVLASASFDRQSALQAAWGPLAGTIGVSGSFTDYANGTDLRAFPVIPCVDSVTGGGLMTQRSFTGGLAV